MTPEDALFALTNEREKLTVDLLKARREHTRLLSSIEQLKEQHVVYAQHLKDLKAAPICSLKEWAETTRFMWHTENQLKNDREKLQNVESFITETNQNLERIRVQTTRAQEEIDGMGRIIRFPSHDDRRSTSQD